MARFFADENFPQPVVEALRRVGHDIVTMADIGQAGKSLGDRAVLDLAASDDRILLTLNRRHFVRIHGSGQVHAGLVVCTFDPDFESQAGRIDAAIRGCPSPARQLLKVNRF